MPLLSFPLYVDLSLQTSLHRLIASIFTDLFAQVLRAWQRAAGQVPHRGALDFEVDSSSGEEDAPGALRP